MPPLKNGSVPVPIQDLHPFCRLDAYFTALKPYFETLTASETMEYLCPLIVLRFMQLEGISKSAIKRIVEKGFKTQKKEDEYYLDVYNIFHSNHKKGKIIGGIRPVDTHMIQSASTAKIFGIMAKYLNYKNIDFKRMKNVRDWLAHGAWTSCTGQLTEADYDKISEFAKSAQNRFERI